MSQPAPHAPSETPVPGALVSTAILLMASMTIMANATISPSLPGLKEHFADVPGIDTLSGLLLTLPSLAILLTAGVWGLAADRLDRQRLLILSGLAYAAGGTSGLWAASFEAMLAGRVLLGIGVAGTMTLTTTWGTDLFHGPARARFMGRQGAAMSAGGIVVSIAGGALAAMHWRGAFAVYLIVVPVVLFALWALAPHVAQRRASAADRIAARAAAPKGGFPWRAFAFVGPLSFLFMAVFYIMPTRLPFHLQDLGVDSPFLIGLIMAGMTLSSVPGSLLYGRIRRHVSAMGVFAWSYGLMGVGMVVVALAGGPIGVFVGVLVIGVGMGPAMPNYTTFMMAEVPPQQRGRAAGLLTTAFFSGQFASPLITAPLVAAFGVAGALEAFAAVMVVLALGLGVAAIMRRRDEAIA